MPELEKSETLTENEKNLQILKRMGDGETAAIEDFYHTYVDRLYSSVFNQVGRDHDICQQIVQDTFLAAVKSASRFRGKCRPYTWLYGIARKKVFDHYRNKYRVRQVIYESLDENEIADSNRSESENLECENEEEETIRKAMECLPAHYREVLLLKYIDEMTMEDIGIALDRSVKSVEGLLTRARARLRQALQKENEGLSRFSPTKKVK
jgi:RNA polymerase sigma factor (sigma-70 family)